MYSKTQKPIVLMIFLLFLLPAYTMYADTGPKPSMSFTFTGEPVNVVSGILYECDQADCSDAAPLEELGPQGFWCEPDHCSAVGYGFAPYHRIEIEFSDGVMRTSNIFETAGFDSEYAVTVRPEDLLVEAQFSLGALLRTGTVLVACACILAAGLMVLAIAVFVLRRRAAA